MTDVLDDLDPESPLGWLRDYIRSGDRAPLTRLRALDRLRLAASDERDGRVLYVEGYDETLMGPRGSPPTARQWLHRYVAGDMVGPKSINDRAHEQIEIALAEAREEGRVQERAEQAREAEFMSLVERDPIAALFQAAEEAGLTPTLHGQPVGETGLRRAAFFAGAARLEGQELSPEQIKAHAAAGDDQPASSTSACAHCPYGPGHVCRDEHDGCMLPDTTPGVRKVPPGYWVTKDWGWEWGTTDKPGKRIGMEMSEFEAIAACRGHRLAQGSIKGEIVEIGEVVEGVTGIIVRLPREDALALAKAGALYSVVGLLMRSTP